MSGPAKQALRGARDTDATAAAAEFELFLEEEILNMQCGSIEPAKWTRNARRVSFPSGHGRNRLDLCAVLAAKQQQRAGNSVDAI
ncbi:hypothetical protein Q2941_34295 [Bradyrhizobium sp. UFLA05-153]